MGRGIYLAAGTSIAQQWAVTRWPWWMRALVVGLVVRVAPAAAQTPPPVAPEPWPVAAPVAPQAPARAPDMRWYGWQTLLADAGAVTLTFALGANVDDGNDAAVVGTAVLGATAFLLGGPIVHAAHGQWGNAGISLALRGGLVLLAGGIGAAIGDGACGQYHYDHEFCAEGYALAGAVMGAVAAVIVDAAMASEPITARATSTPRVAFTPLRGGGSLSLAARF
jgi:hypothetical protein